MSSGVELSWDSVSCSGNDGSARPFPAASKGKRAAGSNPPNAIASSQCSPPPSPALHPGQPGDAARTQTLIEQFLNSNPKNIRPVFVKQLRKKFEDAKQLIVAGKVRWLNETSRDNNVVEVEGSRGSVYGCLVGTRAANDTPSGHDRVHGPHSDECSCARVDKGNHVWHVPHSANRAKPTPTTVGQILACTCPDFANKGLGKSAKDDNERIDLEAVSNCYGCKHVMAADLFLLEEFKRTETEPPQSAPPSTSNSMSSTETPFPPTSPASQETPAGNTIAAADSAGAGTKLNFTTPANDERKTQHGKRKRGGGESMASIDADSQSVDGAPKPEGEGQDSSYTGEPLDAPRKVLRTESSCHSGSQDGPADPPPSLSGSSSAATSGSGSNPMAMQFLDNAVMQARAILDGHGAVRDALNRAETSAEDARWLTGELNAEKQKVKSLEAKIAKWTGVSIPLPYSMLPQNNTTFGRNNIPKQVFDNLRKDMLAISREHARIQVHNEHLLVTPVKEAATIHRRRRKQDGWEQFHNPHEPIRFEPEDFISFGPTKDSAQFKVTKISGKTVVWCTQMTGDETTTVKKVVAASHEAPVLILQSTSLFYTTLL